jgi:hypothetical protein
VKKKRGGRGEQSMQKRRRKKRTLSPRISFPSHQPTRRKRVRKGKGEDFLSENKRTEKK